MLLLSSDGGRNMMNWLTELLNKTANRVRWVAWPVSPGDGAGNSKVSQGPR
jgi:hypothetical protein